MTAIAVAAAGPVSADQAYGPFRHYDAVPGALFMTGSISEGDAFELRKALREEEIRMVVTASPGGNLYEGLMIADIMRDKGILTYVPADASCESSCANIFLGGSSRVADGKLGVHQFRSVSGATDEAETQSATADVISTLSHLGTPDFVYAKMFSERGMYYFSDEEIGRINIRPDEAGEALIAEVSEAVRHNAEYLGDQDHPEIVPETAEVATAPDTRFREISPPPSAPASPKRSAGQHFEDMDFFGADILPKGRKGVSLATCEQICLEDDDCAGFSYVTKYRWCWPKSAVENVTYAPGITSAVVDYDRIAPGVFETGFKEISGHDIPGNDLYPRGLRGLTLPECRQACLDDPYCGAFSWVVSKQWCFPKSGSDGVRKALDTVSGVRD